MRTGDENNNHRSVAVRLCFFYQTRDKARVHSSMPVVCFRRDPKKGGGGAMSLDNTNSDTTSPSHVTIDSLPVRFGVQPLDISLRFWKRASHCVGAPSVTRQWLFPQYQLNKKQPQLTQFYYEHVPKIVFTHLFQRNGTFRFRSSCPNTMINKTGDLFGNIKKSIFKNLSQFFL